MPLIFGITVFLSSFLLFAVQPMLAKFLLPTFGGTAGVWAACVVIFQTLLLAGYAYAHLLRLKLSATSQRVLHLLVLLAALFFLPPTPSPSLASTVQPTTAPLWLLARLVMSSVGVPFFALSATAPLLME